ncbi:haloacid dehalogenase type II [Microbacterium sp. NPDC057659]|uniref:haloacid dehalogenase type II n=1 Tax=Microbacterium sp. NPDC057659 TaxID=3346198 RepID=UPI00366AE57B
MTQVLHGIEVVVFDVLGTLVDEPGGLAAQIAATGEEDPARWVDDWQQYVADQQARIARGERPYAPSSILDAEVAARVGVPALTTVTRSLPAWDDSAHEVARLAQHVTVLGLSNADAATLQALGRHADLRWHRAVSAERVAAYKPDAAVYRAAIDDAAVPPSRILMVAAHAWDLRGAARAGMRTAYVPRPGGDAPMSDDRFDGSFGTLAELVDAVVTGTRL